MQKAADRALMSSTGITTAQSATLVVIAQGEQLTQRDVARQLGLNESAVTGMVTRLLNLKLIQRVEHETDTRAWRLKLSGPGRAALSKAQKDFATINDCIESALDSRELERLADMLARLTHAFGEAESSTPD